MQLTDKQYNRLVELVRDAYESSAMERAGLGHIWPSNDDPLPATENDVTEFIKRRTDLYRRTWQMTPLREALQILADVK